MWGTPGVDDGVRMSLAVLLEDDGVSPLSKGDFLILPQRGVRSEFPVEGIALLE